jgi:hypothetical protein
MLQRVPFVLVHCIPKQMRENIAPTPRKKKRSTCPVRVLLPAREQRYASACCSAVRVSSLRIARKRTCGSGLIGKASESKPACALTVVRYRVQMRLVESTLGVT